METRPPTIGKVLVAVGFAISCFGLLLFLWLTFGGPVPLKSKSYRVTVPFEEATQLAIESDVRISGVSVGKVKNIELSDEGFADATLELKPEFAPIPADTRSILRQKTLLGETYVELTPGNRDGPTLEENGKLPRAQVSDAVQLDEIFRAFDEPTRQAFQVWMQDAAVAFRGRGADLNAAIGNLSPFVARADDVVRILDRQGAAVQQLIRDGGETFDALSRRPGQLAGLIRNTDAAFGAIASRDQELEDSFRALPTFLDESKATLERLERFAVETDPLITQLQPAAKELSGTFEELAKLSPHLVRFFTGLETVNSRAGSGFSALREVLDDQLPPPLARIDSFLNELIPIVQGLRRYQGEVTAFLGNTAAATNGFNLETSTGRQIKYLRSTSPFGPNSLASLPSRAATERTNAYVKAGDYTKLAQGLDSFLTAQCGGGLTTTLDPGLPGDFPDGFIERITDLAFGGELNFDSTNIPRPDCTLQPGSTSIGGTTSETTNYPHVRAQP